MISISNFILNQFHKFTFDHQDLSVELPSRSSSIATIQNHLQPEAGHGNQSRRLVNIKNDFDKVQISTKIEKILNCKDADCQLDGGAEQEAQENFNARDYIYEHIDLEENFHLKALPSAQNEITFYQTNSNEYLSIINKGVENTKDALLFHLLLINNCQGMDLDLIKLNLVENKEIQDEEKLLFASQYDLYSLDNNTISLLLEWSDHYSSYITHHSLSKPSNPISSSMGSLKLIKLKIEYHIETIDSLIMKPMMDIQDSSELEIQLVWLLNMAYKPPHLSDLTFSEKSVKTFLESWLLKRDASMDLVDDLLWNVFYQPADKHHKFVIHSNLVFQFVMEKIESKELVPVFERTNKSRFAKEIKDWIIQSSLSTSKNTFKSLDIVFKEFTAQALEIIIDMAICSLQSKMYLCLINHSSNSLSHSDLSALLSDLLNQDQQTQLQTLLKLFHISNIQSLISDYVLGIPQQSLNSLLVSLITQLQSQSSLQLNSAHAMILETHLPKFDRASLQVVKGICDRLLPDFWMSHCLSTHQEGKSGGNQREFLFLVRSDGDDEDRNEIQEEGIESVFQPAVHYQHWIARMTEINNIKQT